MPPTRAVAVGRVWPMHHSYNCFSVCLPMLLLRGLLLPNSFNYLFRRPQLPSCSRSFQRTKCHVMRSPRTLAGRAPSRNSR